MQFNKRDLILIKFPFSDQTGSKVRPAIIVSNNNFNEKSEDIFLVPITSVLKSAEHSFEITQKNMEKGNLIINSRVRVDKLGVVRKSLFKMKVGEINNSTMLKINKKLEKIL
jgi:mRNA interferase MazF